MINYLFLFIYWFISLLWFILIDGVFLIDLFFALFVYWFIYCGLCIGWFIFIDSFTCCGLFWLMDFSYWFKFHVIYWLVGYFLFDLFLDLYLSIYLLGFALVDILLIQMPVVIYFHWWFFLIDLFLLVYICLLIYFLVCTLVDLYLLFHLPVVIYFAWWIFSYWFIPFDFFLLICFLVYMYWLIRLFIDTCIVGYLLTGSCIMCIGYCGDWFIDLFLISDSFIKWCIYMCFLDLFCYIYLLFLLMFTKNIYEVQLACSRTMSISRTTWQTPSRTTCPRTTHAQRVQSILQARGCKRRPSYQPFCVHTHHFGFIPSSETLDKFTVISSFFPHEIQISWWRKMH